MIDILGGRAERERVGMSQIGKRVPVTSLCAVLYNWDQICQQTVR